MHVEGRPFRIPLRTGVGYPESETWDRRIQTDM
jgi:hypothetical protein